METENSEVHKMIHEGAEVYLNGSPLGNGGVEYEVETPYEEAWHGEMGPSKPRPAKRTFRITMPEGADALQGDWIIKRYTPSGDIRETTFSSQEEARSAMQALRELSLKGHFELVCRPRVEDVVVASYRNEPEEEPLDKSVEEAISDPQKLLGSKRYLDRYDCVREYRFHQGSDGPAWHFRIKGERDWSSHGFPAPVAGPWTEYEGKD